MSTTYSSDRLLFSASKAPHDSSFLVQNCVQQHRGSRPGTGPPTAGDAGDAAHISSRQLARWGRHRRRASYCHAMHQAVPLHHSTRPEQGSPQAREGRQKPKTVNHRSFSLSRFHSVHACHLFFLCPSRVCPMRGILPSLALVGYQPIYAHSDRGPDTAVVAKKGRDRWYCRVPFSLLRVGGGQARPRVRYDLTWAANPARNQAMVMQSCRQPNESEKFDWTAASGDRTATQPSTLSGPPAHLAIPPQRPIVVTLVMQPKGCV